MYFRVPPFLWKPPENTTRSRCGAPLAALLLVAVRRVRRPPELREELPRRRAAQRALRGVGAWGTSGWENSPDNTMTCQMMVIFPCIFGCGL